MRTTAGDPLYWASWLLAAGLTGIVAGCMLGYALLLGPFLEWLLIVGPPGRFGQTYLQFRSGEGRAGLGAFYIVAGLQVLAAVLYLLVALARRQHRAAATVAGAAGVGWVVIHYVSGFGAVEARVLGGSAETPAGLALRFVAWNTPIHYVHALVLTVALGALLSVPLTALRQRE
jgi:hypothetical protein